MYAPGIIEYMAEQEKRERRRRLVHRIVFDALGVVLVVLVVTGDWWMS
jgi:uncharacterized membrane protein